MLLRAPRLYPPGPHTIAQGPEYGEPPVLSSLRAIVALASDCHFTLGTLGETEVPSPAMRSLKSARARGGELAPTLGAFVRAFHRGGAIPPRPWTEAMRPTHYYSGLPEERVVSDLRAAELMTDSLTYSVAHAVRFGPPTFEAEGTKVLGQLGDLLTDLQEARQHTAAQSHRAWEAQTVARGVGDAADAEEAINRLELFLSQVSPEDIERFSRAMQALDPSLGPVDLDGMDPAEFIAKMREKVKESPSAVIGAFNAYMGPALSAIKEMGGPWTRAT